MDTQTCPLFHSSTYHNWNNALPNSYSLSLAHIPSLSRSHTHWQRPTAVALLPRVDSSIHCVWIMSKVTVYSEGDHKNHTAANHRPNHWIRQLLGKTGREEIRRSGWWWRGQRRGQWARQRDGIKWSELSSSLSDHRRGQETFEPPFVTNSTLASCWPSWGNLHVFFCHRPHLGP